MSGPGTISNTTLVCKVTRYLYQFYLSVTRSSPLRSPFFPRDCDNESSVYTPIGFLHQCILTMYIFSYSIHGVIVTNQAKWIIVTVHNNYSSLSTSTIAADAHVLLTQRRVTGKSRQDKRRLRLWYCSAVYAYPRKKAPQRRSE